MVKVVELTNSIPLIDILQMEEDGVNAIEKLKVEMAVKMVREMPKELFDKLFGTIITDPRSSGQWFDLIKKFKGNPSPYNQVRLNRFRDANDRKEVEIEMILQVEI